MQHFPDESSSPALPVGASIEVRSHFLGEWSRGFEIAEMTHDGYRIRRISDRYVLPAEFSGHEVRRAR